MCWKELGSVCRQNSPSSTPQYALQHAAVLCSGSYVMLLVARQQAMIFGSQHAKLSAAVTQAILH